MFRQVLRRLHILNRWTWEFFNFSLRTHRNMSSDRESVLGLLRNGRPLISKLLFATVLSVMEILMKRLNAHTHFLLRKVLEVH
jgi:hypothetical protein